MFLGTLGQMDRGAALSGVAKGNVYVDPMLSD